MILIFILTPTINLFLRSQPNFLFFRVQKYERDLKRWEYMEEESEREKQAIAARRDKYNLGNGNKGGAAFNIITLDYEKSREGEFLKQRDDAAQVRHLLRSKNVDTLSNAGFNLLNG